MQIYLKDSLVYIEAHAKSSTGGVRPVDPVEVVDVSDTASLKRSMCRVFLASTKFVEERVGSEVTVSPVLKHTKFKTWSAFGKGAKVWTIMKFGNAFSISFWLGFKSGGWLADPGNRITFEPEASLEQVCDRMIEILQETAGS
jgi:hypothetical protein